MHEIDIKSFEFALSKIDDGFLFETFSNSFLNAVLGHSFIPVGTTKDKGIDGFQHIFCRNDRTKSIYQISTELDCEGKIQNTINKLKENKVVFDRLYYVTNRKINNKDVISEKLSDNNDITVTIFDLLWFKSNANHSEATINSYNIFVDSHLHEFIKPGKTVVVGNLDTDSRIYVYLREQVEGKISEKKLDKSLADALILFALEGTDPDKEILKTKDEIKFEIKKYVKFDSSILGNLIDERLDALSTKPRKIKYHTKLEGYCLPYDTRLEIRDRNINEIGLLETFLEQTELLLKENLKENDVNVKDLASLIERTIRDIYYQQGLEFANFMVNGDSKNVVEKDLADIIGTTVDKSPVVLKNKEKVKSALLMTIRDIVYNGTIEQKQYLKSLSNTYMMMFMLQWDPKLSLFFESMASKLNIYVCTSIIIPALSELYLDDSNKRHWNLIESANKAGISLFINETILHELVSHFRMINNKYHSLYKFNENLLLDDELEILYIDEIMIRAYFYAKREDRISSFDDFLNNFIDPSLKTAKDDFISYLNEVFGIKYVPDSNLDIKIDEDEYNLLSETLRETKSHDEKADNDAKLILAIYKLREKYNETAKSSIFGYKTWWLSKDTTTYRAVIKAFGEEKYPISCYIRPDFIYNYITLTPNKEEVDETYNKLFPSLLGVNISYHLPHDIAELVQRRLKEHSDKPPMRLKAIIRQLGERIKSDPSIRNKNSVRLYLDEKLKNGE